MPAPIVAPTAPPAIAPAVAALPSPVAAPSAKPNPVPMMVGADGAIVRRVDAAGDLAVGILSALELIALEHLERLVRSRHDADGRARPAWSRSPRA